MLENLKPRGYPVAEEGADEHELGAVGGSQNPTCKMGSNPSRTLDATFTLMWFYSESCFVLGKQNIRNIQRNELAYCVKRTSVNAS